MAYTIDQQHVISASSDGSIRIWDLATCDCVNAIFPAKAADSFADISVMMAQPLVQNPDVLFVVAKLNTAYVSCHSNEKEKKRLRYICI